MNPADNRVYLASQQPFMTGYGTSRLQLSYIMLQALKPGLEMARLIDQFAGPVKSDLYQIVGHEK